MELIFGVFLGGGGEGGRFTARNEIGNSRWEIGKSLFRSWDVLVIEMEIGNVVM